ncbi:MBL fold metallo-hydrolase [Streptomyces sp. KLOTTS4A1]|uniref:MBL fold metallo-hydrolase n=1 Tax=Streptomyces sp. KLOTTS4A1 TaxID=3390996 RepID=UPI0039F63CB1
MDIRWEEFGWEELGDGIGRRRLPVWDATVALVAGSTGALLFDTGASLREGAQIRRQAQALLGGRRVTHIALSHPHFDHVLGTGAFAGVRVYAAAGMDRILNTGREELARDAVRHGLPEGDAASSTEIVIRPHHLITHDWSLDLGGRDVLLSLAGPAHSPYDLVALVPDAGLVLCGDLVEESGEPQAGPDATPGLWPHALDRLLELGGPRPDVRYVPGHGGVVDGAFVRAQRSALAERFGVA